MFLVGLTNTHQQEADLGFVQLDEGKYLKAKVRYLDNNRVGRAELAELVPVEVDEA